MCMHKEDHSDRHDCYHQPSGINGEFCVDTFALKETDCAQSVVSNNIGMITDLGESVLFKDFEKEYPEWKLPQLTLDGANGEFRRMFFACYQKELADHYGKKLSDKCTDTDRNFNRSVFKERLMKIAKQ